MNQTKMPDMNDLMEMLKGLGGTAAGQPAKPKWWQFYSYPDTKEFSPSNLINFTRLSLFFQSLSTNSCLHDVSRYITTSSKDADVLKLVRSMDGRLVYKSEASRSVSESFYVFESGALYVKRSKGDVVSDSLEYNCVSSDPSVVEGVVKAFDSFSAL